MVYIIQCDCGKQHRSDVPFNKEEIVQTCKEKITAVDRTLVNLGNSLDILYAASGESTDDPTTRDIENDDVNLPIDVRKRSDPHLFYFLQSRALNEKKRAMVAAHDFLNFIQQHISHGSMPYEKITTKLLLGNYLDNSDTGTILPGLKNIEQPYFCFEEERNNLSKQVEALHEEIRAFKLESEILKQRNGMLEEKETLQRRRVKEADESITRQNEEIRVLQQKLNMSCNTRTQENKKIATDKNIQNQMDTMRKQMELVERENEKMKPTADELICKQDEIDKLKEKIESCKLENDMLVNGINVRDKDITDLKKSINDAKIETQEKIQKLEKENARQRENSELELEKKEEYSEKVNELNIQLSKVKDECRTLQKAKLTYERAHEIRSKNEEKLKQKEQEILKLSTENKKYKEDTQVMQNEILSLNGKVRSLETSIKDERIINEQLQKEAGESKLLVEQVTLLQEKNVQLQRNIESKANTIKRLKEEAESMAEELELFKRKKVIKVQLFYQRRGELMCAVEEELVALLRRKVESDGKHDVEFTKCLDMQDVKADRPLLLLCISASRIGTDAANTIQGLQLSPKMLLLIFHHKDEHALPNQASCQVLTAQEYKVLGGILDFAFLLGRGIYPWPMNDSSTSKIVNFISTEGVDMST